MCSIYVIDRMHTITAPLVRDDILVMIRGRAHIDV